MEVRLIFNDDWHIRLIRVARKILSTTIPYKEIVDYLNYKLGKPHERGFRYQSRYTRELIRARWREGYSIKDFFKVIDNKVNHWKDDLEMRRYLRPETLFSASHFESYLNETPIEYEYIEEEKEKKKVKTIFVEEEADRVVSSDKRKIINPRRIGSNTIYSINGEYYCAMCREKLSLDLLGGGQRCPYCGEELKFVKEVSSDDRIVRETFEELLGWH